LSPDRAAAAFWAGYIRNRNVDERTAADGAVSVAGGYALYVAQTVFATVLGAGWERPLQAADLDVVEGFFGERGVGASFELSTECVARDRALLDERGYAIAATTDTIFERSVEKPQPEPGPVRIRTTRDRREWASLLAVAMDEPGDALLERSLNFVAGGASILTIAALDGRDIGAAGMLITGDFALLVAGGVLPEARGHGVHSALVRARLRIAHERGATRAAIKTTTGSPAEKTALRTGFVPSATVVRASRA
jgi:GNAT superfamily N-acetyltransferase